MRSEWKTQATPGTFDFSHLDNAEFRCFLEARINKLEPVFTTDFKRQSWQVPFGESPNEPLIYRATSKVAAAARRSAKSSWNHSPARSRTSSGSPASYRATSTTTRP